MIMKRVLVGIGLFLVAACETQLVVPRYADITFAHRPPIALDVASVEVVQAYTPSSVPPNVETEFPVPPSRMAGNWANDRLSPVGTGGVVTVTIREAGVTEEILETQTGLSGLITVDQSERYKARLVVEIVAIRSDGTTARTSSVVERSRTVPEDITLNERETVWYEMTEAMATDLDSQLESAINRFFQAFIR